MNLSREMIPFLQNNLKELRTLAKWKQEDLADKLGISRQTLIKLETQKTEMSQTTFLAIMYLLIGEQDKNPLLKSALVGLYKTHLATTDTDESK